LRKNDSRTNRARSKLFGLWGIDTVLEFIALVSELFVMNYLGRPNLKDEKDNIFAELAFNSGSRYLITKNIKDFTI